MPQRLFDEYVVRATSPDGTQVKYLLIGTSHAETATEKGRRWFSAPGTTDWHVEDAKPIQRI